MSKYPIVILSVISLMYQGLFAQNTDFSPVHEYDVTGRFTAADERGNMYSISNGALLKYRPDGSSVFFSHRQMGAITSVDIADPFNILAFFGDFGYVAILDNNLAPKTILQEFPLADFLMPSAIGSSPGKGFWAWFPDMFQLARIGFNNTLLSSSPPMTSRFPVNVSRIIESGERVFVGASNGVWVFDMYGNQLFTLANINATHFQVIGNLLFYIETDHLRVYDFILEKELSFLLPVKPVKSFFLENNSTIFLQTDVSLMKFRFAGNFF